MIFFNKKKVSVQSNGIPYWSECSDLNAFDSALASLSGHPLQSTLWGSSRLKVDGIPQLLLECRAKNGDVVGLARIEERNIPFFGKIAWLPKGPVLTHVNIDEAKILLHEELKSRGFIVCFTDQYSISQTLQSQCSKTIWLNLTLGLDVLSKGLDSQWRYGANRALREGVIVRITSNPVEVSSFFRLCNILSANKGFSLPGSEALMLELIQSSLSHNKINISLYIGEVSGTIVGGVIVARSGNHLHYMWGASDRRYSKYRVSEAIQWKIIQDGVSSGMERYDLEGIDPIGNPSVYQFKRKMGGIEVNLEGIKASPLSWRGKIGVILGRYLRRF